MPRLSCAYECSCVYIHERTSGGVKPEPRLSLCSIRTGKFLLHALQSHITRAHRRWEREIRRSFKVYRKARLLLLVGITDMLNIVWASL